MKEKELAKLKKWFCILLACFLLTALAYSILYFFFVKKYCHKLEDYWDRYTKFLKIVSFTTLTVTLTVLSLVMMRRIRTKFHALYKDYGHKLWFVVIF